MLAVDLNGLYEACIALTVDFGTCRCFKVQRAVKSIGHPFFGSSQEANAILGLVTGMEQLFSRYELDHVKLGLVVVAPLFAEFDKHVFVLLLDGGQDLLVQELAALLAVIMLVEEPVDLPRGKDCSADVRPLCA